MPPQDELTWCIGPPLRASFVTMLGGEDRADRAVSLYRERFGDVGLFENSVYPDIERHPGRAEAVRTAGCSSPPASRMCSPTASSTISACADHFEHVFGSELDGTRVDKIRSAGLRA